MLLKLFQVLHIEVHHCECGCGNLYPVTQMIVIDHPGNKEFPKEYIYRLHALQVYGSTNLK